MMGYVLDELSVFVRKVILNSNKISQKSSTYNNFVAMAATVVCNYNETAGFSRRGPGPQSVSVAVEETIMAPFLQQFSFLPLAST